MGGGVEMMSLISEPDLDRPTKAVESPFTDFGCYVRRGDSRQFEVAWTLLSLSIALPRLGLVHSDKLEI